MNLGTLVTSLTVETKGLRLAIRDFETLQNRIATGTDKMIRQLGTLSAAIKRMDKNIAQMATNPAVSTWEKKMLAATNKMVRQLGRLTNQTRLLKKEMLSLAGVSGKVGMMMSGAMGGVTVQSKGMGMMPIVSPGYKAGSVVDLSRKLDKSWSNTLSSLSMRLRSFGWLATTVFTFPIVAGATAISKLGRDYEMAMAKIQGLVGINKRMVDEWNKSLLRMSKAVAVGPMELADALYYVSSSGFKTQQALEITEMAAKGAATGLGETKDIANFLTSAMNAYRASGLTAARAMDILTASVREGKGEPAEMARALGTILPIAAELGVSLDQVGGALASMTLITSQTSNAATYLRNVLMKLIHPSAGTEKALERMGSSVGELTTMLKTKGLMPTLLRIRQLTDKYGESVADIFPNIRGLLGVLNLTGQNLKYNEGVMKAVTESMGDFEKAFFIASNTVAFRWNAAVAGMKAGFVSLGVAVARTILPIMEKWIANIQVVVRWFDELGAGTQRVVVRFAAFLAAIGPVSLLFAPLGMVIGGITKRVKELGGMLIWFGRVLVAIPWLVAIAAAAALIIAIVKLVKVRKEEENINKRVNAAVEVEASKLKYLFGVAMDATQSAERRVEAIGDLNEGYRDYLPNIVKESDDIKDLAKAYEAADTKLRLYIATKERQAEVDRLNETVGAKFAKNLGQYTDAALKYLHPMEFMDFSKAMNIALEESSKYLVQRKDDIFALSKSENVLRSFYDTWITGLQEQAKAEGDNARARQLSWIQFESEATMYGVLKARIDPLIATQEELIEKGKAVVKAMDDASRASNVFFETLSSPIKEMMYGMEATEKEMVRWDEYMVGTGQASTIAADKLELYNNIVKELQKSTSPDAAKAIEYISSKIRTLTDTTKDLITETEKLTDIMADFNAKMKVLEFESTMSKELRDVGISFDFVGEKAKLYEATLLKLIEKYPEATVEIQQMIDGLNNLEVNMQPIIDSLLKLGESLEIIQMKSKFEGPKFDVMAESISAYESAINSIIEAMVRMDELKLEEKITVKIDGLDWTISKAEYLNHVLTELYDRLDELKEMQQAAIDREMIGILTEEANAFGGLAGKVEVLNYTLDAAEKQLRALLKRKWAKEDVGEDIKKTVEFIRGLKNEIEMLNQAIEIKRLEDMHNALRGITSAADLLSGYLDVLQTTMDGISATTEGTTEEYLEMAKVFKGLRNSITITERLSDTLGGLYQAMLDGGEGAESLGKRIEEYLGGAFRDLAADILTAITKFIMFEVVLKNFKTRLEATNIGNTILKSLDMEKGVFEVMDLSSIFGTDTIDDFRGALELLMTDFEKLGGIIKSLTDNQTLSLDMINKGTKATDTMSAATKGLTELKKIDSITSDDLVKAEEARIALLGLSKRATIADTAVSSASIPVKRASGEASFFEGVANFFKGAGAMPFPASILALAVVLTMTIAAISLLSKAAKGSKMKEGGIIPPGYPNDTFPALLTSGEKVIPLDRMEKQTWNSEGGEVRFEIEGDRLVGILRKQKKKSLIY